MALHKTRLKEGQRVRFFRTHDKFHELIGRIVKIHPDDVDAVDVEADVDKKNVHTKRVETVHAADVTPMGTRVETVDAEEETKKTK